MHRCFDWPVRWDPTRLNATLAIAVLLPITFKLEPGTAIGFLTTIYIGAICGGLYGAALMRIPGNASSIATTLDGYPLVQKGFPLKALGTGVLANFCGGLLGLLFLVSCAPLIAGFGLKMGPYEFVVLILIALLLVILLSQGAMVKGLLMACLGMSLSLVGIAPIDGVMRLTFGNTDLISGLAIVPVMVGLFAVAQMVREVHRGDTEVKLDFNLKGFGVTLSEVTGNLINILRSSFLGVFVGILPGLGPAAAGMLSWAVAKQSSKTPEEFGTGTVKGVWAAESANNAAAGGALFPLLTLGIPGDTVTALLIAGFMIHGLQPGPLLFVSRPDVIADIYVAFLFAVVAIFLFQLATIRVVPRLLLTPKHFLLPMMLVLTVVGAYSAENRTFDVWLMFAFGALGLILERFGFSLAILILGFILGPIFEVNLRRALTFGQGDLTPFVTRPISGTFIAVTVVAVAGILLQRYLKQRNRAKERRLADSNS